MNRWIDKDPNDTATYALDWAGAVAAGDSIASAVWSALPAGLTLNALTPITSSVCRVTISGGAAGVTYAVQCRATTVQSNILDQSVQLKVREQ